MEPKISIIIPHLGRENGLLRCIESINESDYPQNKIEILVIEGPETVPQKVAKGVKQATGEIYCYAANDMEFYKNCLTLAVEECMKEHGLVSFNEGPLLPDEGNICTHFVIHKDLVADIGGDIFDTDFHHLGVDNLLWAKTKKLGKATWLETAQIVHHHFSIDHKPMDEVYTRGWSHIEEDRALLAKKLLEI